MTVVMILLPYCLSFIFSLFMMSHKAHDVPNKGLPDPIRKLPPFYEMRQAFRYRSEIY